MDLKLNAGQQILRCHARIITISRRNTQVLEEAHDISGAFLVGPKEAQQKSVSKNSFSAATSTTAVQRVANLPPHGTSTVGAPHIGPPRFDRHPLLNVGNLAMVNVFPKQS